MTQSDHITKKDRDELVDLLGNFELTRGCLLLAKESYRIDENDNLIKNGHSAKHVCAILGDAISIVASSNEREVVTVCERGEQSLYFGHKYIKDYFKILGHPILLTTVLAKAQGRLDTDDRTQLLELWDDCGFTTSFQEITADGEWEEIPTKYIHAQFGAEPISYEQLKSPASNQLCIFLRDLFLNNSK